MMKAETFILYYTVLISFEPFIIIFLDFSMALAAIDHTSYVWPRNVCKNPPRLADMHYHITK